jgi:transcriptional regulator with XRE-family HTH domain
MARPVDHRAREMSAWRHLCIAFGARVKFLREEQNISAVGLAEAIGCTKAVIWGWERGKCIPSVPVLLMVAAALDCSLVDLMPEEAHYRVEPIRERARRAA